MATITADITASATTVPVSEELVPGYYVVDSENVVVTNSGYGHSEFVDSHYASLDRGVGGTTAATHSSGATLTRYYPDSGTLQGIADGPQIVRTIPAVFRVSSVVDDEPQVPFEVGPDRANFDVGEMGTVSITRTAFDNAQIYFMSGSDSLIYMQNDNGDTVMYTKFNGLTQLRPIVIQTAAPADGDLSNGQAAIWFDATNGAAKLKIKAKQANGTVVVGEVALT